MFLKGDNNGLLDTLPKVRYYTMGINKWQTSDTWPPKGAQPMTFYLSSGGKANTLNGDGVLTMAAPASGQAGQIHVRSDESGACRTAATSAAPGTRCRAARSISARWKSGRTFSSTRPSRSRKASK